MIKPAFLILALGIASCGTTGTVVSPATLVTAEKALTVAHLAYDGVGMSLKTASDTGVLKGTAAATAKCWYDKAGDELAAADAADIALNAADIASAITKAQDAIVQAKTPTAACTK